MGGKHSLSVIDTTTTTTVASCFVAGSDYWCAFIAIPKLCEEEYAFSFSKILASRVVGSFVHCLCSHSHTIKKRVHLIWERVKLS